ncbi:MAG: hypothetical protein ABR964_05515 [Tepidisphaeraceae bacterium]
MLFWAEVGAENGILHGYAYHRAVYAHLEFAGVGNLAVRDVIRNRVHGVDVGFLGGDEDLLLGLAGASLAAAGITRSGTTATALNSYFRAGLTLKS